MPHLAGALLVDRRGRNRIRVHRSCQGRAVGHRSIKALCVKTLWGESGRSWRERHLARRAVTCSRRDGGAGRRPGGVLSPSRRPGIWPCGCCRHRFRPNRSRSCQTWPRWRRSLTWPELAWLCSAGMPGPLSPRTRHSCPARRHHGRDGPSDPERVQPLTRLDIAGVLEPVLPAHTALTSEFASIFCHADVARLALLRPPPASAPPGHD